MPPLTVTASPSADNPRTPAQPPQPRSSTGDLYRGPPNRPCAHSAAPALDEKLRQAYCWMSTRPSPRLDTRQPRPGANLRVRGRPPHAQLPSAQSYSIFVLLPLLPCTRRKACSSAFPARQNRQRDLMGSSGRRSKTSARHATRPPQMTFPPAWQSAAGDLVNAKHGLDPHRLRSLLGMRVKITTNTTASRRAPSASCSRWATTTRSSTLYDA